MGRFCKNVRVKVRLKDIYVFFICISKFLKQIEDVAVTLLSLAAAPDKAKVNTSEDEHLTIM